MWEQIESSRANYRSRSVIANGDDREPAVASCSISVDGPGGSQGWQLTCRLDREPRETEAEADENRLATFQVRPVSAKTLPKLSEAYIRGEDLVLTYAQQERDPFGLSMQVTPIECSERMTIIQLTISLQTDLLDSHPSIELSAAAAATTQHASESPAVIGPRQLSATSDEEVYGTIVLAPRDQRAAGDFSDAGALRVQLFGNFLEKGVIRKSRPWVVIWRGGRPGPSEMEMVYQRLRQTPLPLTT